MFLSKITPEQLFTGSIHHGPYNTPFKPEKFNKKLATGGFFVTGCGVPCEQTAAKRLLLKAVTDFAQ